MTDFLFESLAIQRIELVARLVASQCSSSEDRELALAWIAEMATTLATDVDQKLQKSPQQDGSINSVGGDSTI